MAGASMKDIKRRIRSVESTMQITKAMQLVASSKLRRARDSMESSKPFFTVAEKAMRDLARYSAFEANSKYLKKGESGKILYIVLAGDRGLAGGYNANIFKCVFEDAAGREFACLPVGKKALERFRMAGSEIVSDAYQKIEGFKVSSAFSIGEMVKEGFLKGEWSEVKLAYTNFTSMLSQTAMLETMLPIAIPEGKRPLEQMLVEPDAEKLFEEAVRIYLSGLVFSASKNAFASEVAARRTAMDNATRNAGDMIESLKLNYNRARQGAITQELTEIVAGAEH
ncbi:MAG: ATP synthase F1 subunit gamma [Clostridia bacterium]|nr:ATP synthase F1 subunit gamma [Clostridia bacterium]